MIVIQSGFARVDSIALNSKMVAIGFDACRIASAEDLVPELNTQLTELENESQLIQQVLEEMERQPLVCGQQELPPALRHWQQQNKLRSERIVWETEVWEVSTRQLARRYPLSIDQTGGTTHGLALDPVAKLPLCATGRGLAYGDGRAAGLGELSGVATAFALSNSGERAVCGIAVTDMVCAFDGSPCSSQGQLTLFTRGARYSGWRRKQSVSDGQFEFAGASFLPDGQTILVSVIPIPTFDELGPDRPRAGLFRLLDGERLEVRHQFAVEEVPRLFAVCGEVVATFINHGLEIRALADLNRPPIQIDSTPEVTTVAADPHGRFLLTASSSSVSVWDPKSWTVAKTFDWKAGPITCLAVAPDGLTAAAGTATGKVVVWDVE